jgi:MYXO-CTERM domain-containing protein
VVFGGVAPGFDDFTENWGACQSREIPRDPEVLAGQMGYLSSLTLAQTYDVRGVILDTWDDWTEGSELEPEVTDGPAKLLQFKQLLGALYAEPDDPAGDQTLALRWLGYGQARSCCFEDGPCEAGVSPAIDLSCPAQPQPGGDAAPAGDAAAADAGAGAEEPPSTGCGCDAAGAGSTGLAWLAAGLAALGLRRRRRARTLSSAPRHVDRDAVPSRQR